jgi:hypothetical protein
LTCFGRKEKPRCRAPHWRQRNGRKSNGSRNVHSSTPRRWERRTSLLPQSGHRLGPTSNEIACVFGIRFTLVIRK